ncbi:hypothetical protein PF003_g13253 [Phytophthora fragariae]|uniref:Uncharacterized protein n=1 Tax=Phytophthora fragariae TaxID=53985 RepID=A0A6A3DC46_9STRA|nr:hypothetical protein PF003_g13256 [Phytophthora fragariae]KAE8902541.1 hypothetical protein PF003_g13253 [Phytophthora fragariae]KAE8918555.1 hypothetical protein PF009_g31132 [Phytophthora fragariae]
MAEQLEEVDELASLASGTSPTAIGPSRWPSSAHKSMIASSGGGGSGASSFVEHGFTLLAQAGSQR